MKDTFSKTVRFLFWAISSVYLLYIAGSLILFLSFDYKRFVSIFSNLYPQAYRVDEYGEKYFTVTHYLFIKQNAPILLLGVTALFALMILKRRDVSMWVNRLIEDIRWIKLVAVNGLTDLSIRQSSIVLGCFISIIVLKVYFFISLPFYIDEVFNFVYFVKEGIFHSTIFANNHVLTNIISSCWWKLGLSPELSIRLTSIVSSLAVYAVVYLFTKYYFNFRTAVFILVLLVASFWINVYSIEGGAYMLMSLWVILGFVSICSHRQALFVISCVMGLYTTALYLIPMFALLILWTSMAIYESTLRAQLLGISKSVLLIALMSMLLYLPMSFWSGAEAAFHSNVSRYDLVFMKPALFEGFSVMTEVNTKSSYALLVLLVPCIIIFRRIDQKLQCLVVLLMSTIFSIVAFSLMAGVYPPSRALIFSNIIFLATAGIAIISLIEYSTRKFSTVILSVVAVVKIATSIYLFNFGWQHMPRGLQDAKFYKEVNALSNELLAQHPKIIFANERDTFLNFYLIFNAVKNGAECEVVYDLACMDKADFIIINDEKWVQDSRYVVFYEGDLGIISKRK